MHRSVLAPSNAGRKSLVHAAPWQVWQELSSHRKPPRDRAGFAPCVVRGASGWTNIFCIPEIFACQRGVWAVETGWGGWGESNAVSSRSKVLKGVFSNFKVNCVHCNRLQMFLPFDVLGKINRYFGRLIYTIQITLVGFFCFLAFLVLLMAIVSRPLIYYTF